ncbi:MAG: hypothetical protein ACREA3_06620 [Nitrosotalea sp.]
MRYVYLVFLLLFPTSLVFAENSTGTNCSATITAEEKTLSGAVNQNKAIALANISEDFTSILQKENLRFDHIQYDWTIDNQTCNVALKNVNVIFQLWTWCCGNNAIFQENPSSTMITDVTKTGLTCGTFCPAYPPPHHSFCVPSNQTENCLDSPLKQFKGGVNLSEIECSDNLPTLVIKTGDNSPACVRLQTAENLVERGWGLITEYSIPRLMNNN